VIQFRQIEQLKCDDLNRQFLTSLPNGDDTPKDTHLSHFGKIHFILAQIGNLAGRMPLQCIKTVLIYKTLVITSFLP
jgi:hypothetical protein